MLTSIGKVYTPDSFGGVVAVCERIVLGRQRGGSGCCQLLMPPSMNSICP